MNWQLFFSVYALIFVAELPDKTAFATLLMATRGRAMAVFTGVALAFLIQTIVAGIFGSLLSLAPEKWIHLGAGILFLAFAAHTWLSKDEDEVQDSNASGPSLAAQGFFVSVWKSFLVIFIAEWGDLTQIATASLMAKYHENPVTVFTAALLALWSVTAVAVFLGQKLATFINPRIIKKVSSIVFLGIGLYFVGSWFR